MSEWKEYKLGETVDLITGFPFKGDKYELSGMLKVVRGENVTLGTLRWDSEKYWNHSTEDLEKYYLAADDIVIGMDGSRVGKNRAIIREEELPLILAQRVARLRAKKNFDQKFIWYQIYSKKFTDYVEAIQTGTSIPHISPTLINEFEIEAPSYKEQKVIAETVSSLDDKIDLLQCQNKTLETLTETVFRQWFVEEAEESWEMGVVGDLFILQRGFDLPSQNRIEGNYPIVTSSGVNGMHKEFKVKGPGVTTGRSGLLGNVYYINEDFWPLNTSLFIKEYKIALPLFSYFFLKTLDIKSLNGGSAVPTLNRNDVHQLETQLPSVQLVSDFEEVAKINFAKIQSNTIQINTLTALRDMLLPKLMSGEVQVKN